MTSQDPLDNFDDRSSERVSQQHMDKMKHFVEKHGEKLKEIEEDLGDRISRGWDFNSDPISISLSPYEQTSMLDLVKMKSKPVKKRTLVFAALCDEISFLKQTAENTFYPGLILFGELDVGNPTNSEGESQLQLGRMFPFLLELTNYVNRCWAVVKNIVRQLGNLYNVKQKETEDLRFDIVWKYLGLLFEVLITLNGILTSNTSILASWGEYKRMIKQIKKDPPAYNVDKEEKLWQFEEVMLKINSTILDGGIFKKCIIQEFDEPGKFQVARGNPLFKQIFWSTIKAYHTGLLNIATKKETFDALDGSRYIRATALFVFYCTMFPDVTSTEKKLLKDLWEISKHIPIVHLYGNVTWDSCTFFADTIPKIVSAAKLPNLGAKKGDYLSNLVSAFPSKVREMYLLISKWTIHMESSPETLSNKPVMLLKGLNYAQHVSMVLQRYLYLHIELQRPITAQQIPLIFQCFQMLKSIKGVYHRRLAVVGEVVSYMTQKVAGKMQELLLPPQGKLVSSASSSNDSSKILDSSAAVALAIQMLNGPPTKTRAIVFQLAYHQIPSKVLHGVEAPIAQNLNTLDQLANLISYVDKSCDCSMILWATDLMVLYFQYIYKNPTEANKLTFLFAAIRDVIPLIYKVIHVTPEAMLEEYRKKLESILKDEIVQKLCHEIHQDLAEHIHHSTKNFQVSRKLELGPFKYRDLNHFLRVRPLKFWNIQLDISAMVTHWLDCTFYNLNTVTLFDWATFGEMRSLARDKYNLKLAEVHLPGQTLEQGLDVLDIMKNLPSFVANYRYNLNNQIFIEASSANTTLSTITVKHVANSIRTHGTGIMNTAVSVTYQFLKEKFHLFSQFLFDEMIKAPLLREQTFFNESKKQSTSKAYLYPVKRARDFINGIKAIGLTKDNKTYLDKFRHLITEIGNAMGYVRMIRSGGLLYTSDAIQFVPDLTNIEKFKELVEAENLSQNTQASAGTLDSVVDTLNQNFSEGSEYYKMLVNVFSTEYRSPDNAHLQNFYLILPALTLKHIEQSGIDKEKFAKKGREEGTFTDDGFALGIAYILKLLNQNKDFDSLNWFKSVTDFYQQELQAKTRDKENVKISQLTKNKLAGDLREFELLKFAFCSARILFHD